MNKQIELFQTLSRIDVSGFKKYLCDKDFKDENDVWQKKALYYLPWTVALTEFNKFSAKNPDLNLAIVEEKFTTIFIQNKEIEIDAGAEIRCTIQMSYKDSIFEKTCLLPVINSNNKPLKTLPYTIETKYKKIEVPAIDSMSINTARQRCFVKCLALFGFGITLFLGDDNYFETHVETPENKPSDKPSEKFESKESIQVSCDALFKNIDEDEETREYYINHFQEFIETAKEFQRSGAKLGKYHENIRDKLIRLVKE